MPPVAVRLSQWFTNKAQGIAIRSIMGAGSVYKKAYKFLAETKLIKIAASTIFRWLQRLGEEYIEISEILGIKYSGILCIDEKWVKILGRWYYVFLAVDTVTLDLVCIDIFEDNGSYSAKTFLLELKSAGYNPKIIVTDMLNSYPNVILEVFPGVKHKECILHAKWHACRIIRKYIKSGGLTICAKELKKKLYKYFNSETERQLNIRYKKLQRIKENYVSSPLLEIYKLIERVYPKLLIAIKDKDVPKTNNYVERVIREFNSKYKNICGFGSYWCARNYIKVFSVYYRFRKFEEGARKGSSPLELAGYDIKDIDFVDYLVAFI